MKMVKRGRKAGLEYSTIMIIAAIIIIVVAMIVLWGRLDVFGAFE